MAQALARYGKAGWFHIANTCFEGFIGWTHVFMPDQIYGGGDKGQEALLSMFTGSLMMAFAFITWAARKDMDSDAGKAVLKGMIAYHATATLLNAVWGCGIDGRENLARDFTHVAIHGSIALGGVCTLILGGKGSAAD